MEKYIRSVYDHNGTLILFHVAESGMTFGLGVAL